MNNKLKRIVADLSLDRAMLQEVLQKSSEAWAQARTCRRTAWRWKVSIRRACSTLRIDRSLYVYRSKRRPGRPLTIGSRTSARRTCDTAIGAIHVLLQRDGWAANIKRVYRLYRELGLQLRNKTPKRRVKGEG